MITLTILSVLGAGARRLFQKQAATARQLCPPEQQPRASYPNCPFCHIADWRAVSRANITYRAGGTYIRQEFECRCCRSRTRMGRFMWDNWDYVTSVIG